MLTDQEIALVQADTPLQNGRTMYWVFSRKQVEFILSDVTPLPSVGGASTLEKVPYQEEALPVLNLENYFGLKGSGQTLSDKYIVVKTATENGDMVKLTVRITHPVRMRPLTFSTSLAMRNGLNENSGDILGAFLDDEDGLYIVPDISTILGKLNG